MAGTGEGRIAARIATAVDIAQRGQIVKVDVATMLGSDRWTA